MGPHAVDLAPFWLRMVAGFAAGAVTWVVVVDYGVSIVSRRVTFSHPAARIGVGAALGYALLGSIVALLGFVGGIHATILYVLLVLALLVRYAHHRRARTLPAAWMRARDALAHADPSAKLALVVIACAAITGLANAALPAVWWDPIAYHLPIAAAALDQGAFGFNPHMAQSGFPLLGEAAALPAYAVAGSAGAAMVTLGAGLCVALLVWALADGLKPGSGPLAAMLAASSALWAWLSPSFYVDVPFAMFVVAAIVTALQLRVDPDERRDADSSQALAIGALAGALCGAAAAVKYSGLGATLVVVAVALWIAGPGRAKVLAGFAGGFAFIAAGWYARSLILTGDPLYPFLSTSAGHQALVRDFALRYVEMTRHWCGGGTSLADLVSLPYRLIAQPQSFCGDPGLALRAGVIFALAAAFVVRPARVIATAAIALTALWFVSSQQWRFLLPALFLYAAIVAAGTYALGRSVRMLGVVVLAALGAFVVATNWIPQTRSEASASLIPALAYMSGRQSAQVYLNRRLETFGAAQWVAALGVSGNEVGALDDVRDYYFPPGTAWLNPYYQQAVALDWSAPSSQRYRPLVARGISYLVVNENPAYLHRTPTGVDWTAFANDKRTVLRELYSANGVSVYALGSAH